MQFKKEWVVPAAVGVGSFGAGIFVGTTLGLFRIIKGTEGINEYIGLFQTHASAAESRLIEIDELGRRLERVIEGYERLYEAHRRADGTQQSSDGTQQEVDEEKQETSEQLNLSFDESKENESETGIGFSQQNELKKQAVMAQVDETNENMVNVFRVEDDDWDWDEQMAKRRPDRPYIIHRDEYFNEERADEGFTQSTVTYYGGDGILCDESDVPIYEADQIVGKLEFGRGSGDPNVCYVRNERLLIDYEVLLEPGWFGAEVLGQHVQDLIEKSKKAKLEHSVPKFRPE